MHLRVDSLSAPIEGKRTIDERYHTTPKYRMEFLSHRSILGTTSDKCIAVVQSPEAAFSEHSNSLGRFVNTETGPYDDDRGCLRASSEISSVQTVNDAS